MFSDKKIHLESNRLFYDGIKKEDSELILAWRNSSDIRNNSNNKDFISIKSHETWFTKYLENQEELRMIFSTKKQNKKIGMIGGTIKNEYVTLSYYIGESEYRGYGYASEAIETFIVYLSSIEIKRIYAYVLHENLKSIDCLTKLGFTKEASVEVSANKKIVFKFDID